VASWYERKDGTPTLGERTTEPYVSPHHYQHVFADKESYDRDVAEWRAQQTEWCRMGAG
jgi:hypothetical protein